MSKQTFILGACYVSDEAELTIAAIAGDIQDRALVLDAMYQAVSRLYAYENQEPGEGEGKDAAA